MYFCCVGNPEQTMNQTPYMYLYRWGLRHVVLEFIMCLVALALGQTYIFMCSFISLCGASVSTCCCLSYTGWRINLFIQILTTVLRVVLFILIVVSMRGPTLRMGVIFLICILISITSVVPFIFESRKVMRQQGIVPTEDPYDDHAPVQMAPAVLVNGLVNRAPIDSHEAGSNVIEAHVIDCDVPPQSRRGHPSYLFGTYPTHHSHEDDGIPIYVEPSYIRVADERTYVSDDAPAPLWQRERRYNQP